MHFIGEPPEDLSSQAWLEAMRHHAPPENEVAAPVPIREFIARGDDLAAVLTGVRVYSNGLTFTVTVHSRPGSGDTELHDLLSGMGRLHAPSAGLLLGVEFSDGRTASTLTHRSLRRLIPRPCC